MSIIYSLSFATTTKNWNVTVTLLIGINSAWRTQISTCFSSSVSTTASITDQPTTTKVTEKTTTTTATTEDPGPCYPFCARNKLNWGVKCNWELTCQGCPECKLVKGGSFVCDVTPTFFAQIGRRPIANGVDKNRICIVSAKMMLFWLWQASLYKTTGIHKQ